MNRAEAIRILQNDTNWTFTKPVDTYSDSYLKRQASFYQRSQQAGVTPTRAAGRGHRPKATITFIEGEKKPGKTLDRLRMEPSIKNPDMQTSDLKRLMKEAEPRAEKRNGKRFLLFVFTGTPKEISPTSPAGIKLGDPGQSRSSWLEVSQIKEWIKRNPQGDMTDFSTWACSVGWEELTSISVVFPKERNTDEQKG